MVPWWRTLAQVALTLDMNRLPQDTWRAEEAGGEEAWVGKSPYQRCFERSAFQQALAIGPTSRTLEASIVAFVNERTKVRLKVGAIILRTTLVRES